jgi:hypothetical protein
MKKLVFFLLFLMPGLLNLPGDLKAQFSGYLKIEGALNSIKGGFDGKSVLSSSGSDFSYLLPELIAGPGFGLTIGILSYDSKYSMGFKYELSLLNESFDGENLGTASFHNFSIIEFTYFFPEDWGNILKDRPLIQFHVTTGFEVGILRANDCYYKTPTSMPLDASYTIIGLPIEPGITLNFLKACSVNLSAGYKLSTTTIVKESGTVDPGPEIGDWIGGGGFFCNLGVILPLRSRK